MELRSRRHSNGGLCRTEEKAPFRLPAHPAGTGREEQRQEWKQTLRRDAVIAALSLE